MVKYINSQFSIKGFNIPNRVVFQPMEGCDCNNDGSPGNLTREKYIAAAKSGAGIIWFEANAVCPEGRTNPRQMMLTRENIGEFKSLIKEMREITEKEGFEKALYILQLTHSGRQSIKPMIAYRHPIYEEKRPVTDDAIVTDEYLDTLPSLYADSAKLAYEAGFDGVDVKSCHGYLFQELLSAFSREGRYGGSFKNRTRLYLDAFRAVKAAIHESMLLTARISISDMIEKPYGFGTDENGNLDLSEPDRLLAMLIDEGLEMLNVTVGNPYFNPHVNRPYRSGGYTPPETAACGLERFEIIEEHIKKMFPSLPIVASGLSYYRENPIEKAESILEKGIADFAGFGRMILAYPEFYKDYLNGCYSAKKACVTCSKCTVLMRNKCVSGCAVFNEYYRNLYKEKVK